MKNKDNIESFFKTTDTSWWNPVCTHDNRFWLFKRQLEYIRSQLFKRVIKIGGSVALDAGCGRGIHSKLLSDLGCVVTSLDINQEMLRLTGGICDTKLVQGSLMDMPFEQKSFDIVVSIGTTMHVSSIDTMMSEIGRVIKGDGVVMVSIANKYSLYVLWATKLNSYLVKHQNKYHRQQFSYWAFRKIISRHGFSVVDSAGFAVVPPISLQTGWRNNVINPVISRILSMPFDWILGKYFGCGVTFVLKKK